MIIVRCPKCSHDMKYMPLSGKIKKKRCVYCGHTFTILTEKGNRIIS